MVDEAELADGLVVVIDVLRASTTLITALAAGAREIIPCVEVEQARDEAAQFAADEVLLAGEREALPIEGFDLGNSPAEYTPEQVAGKTIVFTTTNGTHALAKCGRARRTSDRRVRQRRGRARTACRRRTDPLALCRHRSKDELRRRSLRRHARRAGPPADEMAHELNAQAITAAETWKHAFAIPMTLGAEPLPAEILAAKLRESLGGESLVRARLEEDILAAAQDRSLHTGAGGAGGKGGQ